jgi:sugar phosphate isomerase/epimerase
MTGYEQLGKDVDAVTADAHTLGAEYVVCGTIPHQRYLSAENCTRAIEDFGRWGKRLASAGLHLCYHTHGVEFGKSAEGTLFDTLVQGTDARYVNFEMDIFWIVFAFHDPAKLLRTYPGRFPSLHVKDIRKGLVLGRTPADVMEEDSVPLGTGIVDIPAALRAAQENGARHYYIEDEAVNAAEQIPKSLKYLESIRW